MDLYKIQYKTQEAKETYPYPHAFLREVADRHVFEIALQCGPSKVFDHASKWKKNMKVFKNVVPVFYSLADKERRSGNEFHGKHPDSEAYFL